MLRDGCTDARQIGGAGDNGADVLATDPLGRAWVIQVKHRKDGDRGSAVGTPTSSGSTAPPASSTAPTSSSSSPTAASPPAARPSRRIYTCTSPTGRSSPRGRAAGPRSGSSCRGFPHRGAAGDRRGHTRRSAG
ncbi:restriction endonuclease [Streptomyces anulatus]